MIISKINITLHFYVKLDSQGFVCNDNVNYSCKNMTLRLIQSKT